MDKPETKIEDAVLENEPEYLYEDDTFGKIEVGIDSEGENNAYFLVVTDEEFARERLKTAEKHFRDYGELPDKGQFPFTKYDGKQYELVFHGNLFVLGLEENDRLERISH